MSSLGASIELAWWWVAVPLAALAGLVLLLLLRVPTFTRLPEALRAMREPGDGPAPASSVFLASAASLGAGAAVAGAMAVSLGGAGSLAWLWLFGIVLAPLRLADVLLSRTSPPGRATGEPAGSLAGRLQADASPVVRALGGLLLAAMVVAASVGVLGVHGAALAEISEAALPGSAMGVGAAVAVAAALLAILGRDKPWLGWLAGAAVVALLLLGFVACLVDPGRALGAIVRSFEDALHGAAPASAFSGALASEVARAALLQVLPPMVLTLGTDGALYADARGGTKRVASSALLSTLAHVVVATAVGLALIATGAYSRRVEGERRLSEITFVDAPFDTASQRIEPERLWTGFLRVNDGRAQAEPLEGATERGMIDDTRFVGPDGEPGDLALRVRRGQAELLLEPDDAGALVQSDPSRLRQIRVTGRMLPMGGALVNAAMTRVGGEVTVRLTLAVLLVLVAVGAAALGIALARTLERRIDKGAARVVSVLPGLALLVACVLGAAGPTEPPLGALGLLGASVIAIVASLAILAKSVEVTRL
ncbi:MAG: hypothetical protein U0353_25770 [Sandaracinus sp.]